MKVTVLLLALGAATIVAAASLASTETGKSPGTAASRTVLAGSDGPDIQIRSGTIIATAADYQMDGTMWVAFAVLEDSNTYVYSSTDHGLSWQFQVSMLSYNRIYEKIGLVVGEGDSAFFYLFYLDSDNNGDLGVLRGRVGDSARFLDVAVGPDTIRDFAVCRDYSGGNYWLYAVLTNSDLPPNVRSTRFIRSANYGVQWEEVGGWPLATSDPHIAAGAGSYLYLAARAGDTLLRGVNTSYFEPGDWYVSTQSFQDEILDPVIGASFTLPESAATAWCLWSQNYQNSGDWDIKYSYLAGVGQGWSTPAYLAGTTAADEQFPDLRNYTSLGNQYINASYISEAGPDRCVYRHYANGANPSEWSDTLRINEGNAGTGSEVRPRLCYTPGAPFTGAGAVFVGAGLNGCWWNAPYPVSVETPEKVAAATRLDIRPHIGRGPFHIRAASPASIAIHDHAGRLVRSWAASREPSAVSFFTWDGRDNAGSTLPSGVYFVSLNAGDYTGTEKLVLQR